MNWNLKWHDLRFIKNGTVACVLLAFSIGSSSCSDMNTTAPSPPTKHPPADSSNDLRDPRDEVQPAAPGTENSLEELLSEQASPETVTQIAPFPNEDQEPVEPEKPPDASLSLCRTLFGLEQQEECHFPLREVIGGSFQKSDANPIVNPLTDEFSCPDGYEAAMLAQIFAFNPVDPTLANNVTIHLCLSETRDPVAGRDLACPPGQARFEEHGRSLCSDLPVRACLAFDGVLEGLTGRCLVGARESIFGGFFETGEMRVNSPSPVTVLSPDKNPPQLVDEHCETPNQFFGLDTCSCPPGFGAFSSSTYAEFIPDRVAFDRLSLCLRVALPENDVLPPRVDGCLEAGQEIFTIGDQTACRSDIYNLCKKVGGTYESGERKCRLRGREIFGGSFQIGFSDKHAFGPLPKDLQFKDLGERPQFCESANPILTDEVRNSERGCACPTGFKPHLLAHIEETPEGDYDREYLCLSDQ